MLVCRNKNKFRKYRFPKKKKKMKLAQNGYTHDYLNNYIFISCVINNFMKSLI